MYDVMMHALGASEMSRSRIHEKNFFKVVSPEKVFTVIVKENGVVFGWAFQGKGEAGEHLLSEYELMRTNAISASSTEFPQGRTGAKRNRR